MKTRRNGFVGIALLGTLIVLAAADPAEAQRRARRGRGMDSAPAYSPGYQQPTAESAAPSQYPVEVQRRGRRGRVIYSAPGSYPGSQQPAMDPAAPRPDPTRYSFYPPPARNSAQIQMRLPNPQAEVRFDGQNTQQKGLMRLFTTPPLDGTYSYQVTAAWQQDGQPVTRERTISVRPGATVTIDFTADRPAPKQ